ncbi:glycoside hydrolase family 3 protein [Luteococcus peritonei]|uniref:beta-N-acetylhexosaminidase n=1 Tax=Luteococcus peritonei TaxID=88874 RepID=A0ABW4RZM2_9ACTN
MSQDFQINRRHLLAGLGVAAAANACPGAASPALAEPRPRPGEVAIPGASAADRAWARRMLRGMSLEQKVGQVFNSYVHGASATTVTEAEAAQNLALYGVRTPAEVVQKYHLGGVIYFAWSNNVANPTQIAELSNGLQRAVLADGRGIPLTISTDQEQGLVTRIGAPATLFPGAMALGATGSDVDARKAGRVTGEELRAMGITMDFAPVADVNVNPANPVIGVRSSGSDPQLVAAVVAAQVEGLQSAKGVSATAKHFPGHGDTATDSHLGLPVITHSREQWEATDLPPFRAAIEAGIDAIMTAHLLVPALDDSGDPATLSPRIITGVLREELGFTGLVVTDGLAMAGVREKYGDDEVAVRALLAGDDMLLQSPDLPKAWNAVLAAVRSGRLPMARLDEAVLRNLQLKAKRGVVKRPLVEVGALGRLVGTARNQRIAEAVANDSTTLLRNQDVLPVRAKGLDVVVCGWSSGTTTLEVVAAELARHKARPVTVATGAAPGHAQIDAAVAAAAKADLVVVTTYNVTATSAQRTLVQALLATDTPVVVIAVRNPHDIAQFPEVDAYLASYSFVPVALQAAVRSIVGSNIPSGRLPVAIPAASGGELYPVGAGIGY